MTPSRSGTGMAYYKESFMYRGLSLCQFVVKVIIYYRPFKVRMEELWYDNKNYIVKLVKMIEN